MKIRMTAISERQRARFYIYKKQIKLLNVFIYKNGDTFQKAVQFPFCFYIQKARHFTLSDISWNFWSWHLITKSMTLCVTGRFYIQKARYFAKSKTICVTFLCSKIRTLCITRFFIEFLKFAEGGGIFKCKKQCTLSYIFMLKNNALCVTFYIQKIRHDISVTFLFAKNTALCVTFLYLKFIVHSTHT